ncbi:hypothetical protein [Amphibacillus cookii]|uniref:hypothetical protein n=1 Tax=Amphibacillus cookii TaxID=767787 RepID=UPI00195B9CC7|nr:hypothetical protein [Amphibacillus cookii]MBM7541674.1 membrane protein involved in colicin uptake [Amphibacillus cookii]
MDEFIAPLITFLLIIGGSLLKNVLNNTDNNADESKRKRTQQTKLNRPVQERQKTERAGSNEKAPNVAAQKNAQIEQLRKHLNVASDKNNNQVNKQAKQMQKKVESKLVSRQKTISPKAKRLAFKRNLSRKGLAESVVMAEILGTPRAKRPYQANTRNVYK